jgi:hypothetical protein
MSVPTPRLDATLVLPIRSSSPVEDELVTHLRWLADLVEVVVVDGSDPAVAAGLERQVAPFAVYLRPDPDLVTHAGPDADGARNGKVTGVITGLRRATTDLVVIADDDVRYDEETLTRVVEALGDAACVVPANHFAPLPWHARWDTGRTLCNRAVGHDLPGTMGVRRRFLLEGAGGYAGDVLFENLELLRTVQALGGPVAHLPDCHVRRRPPTTRHFLGQRVRQAYDELARPWRMTVFLVLLPAGAALARRRPVAAAAAWFAVPTVLAEIGRRRHGGRSVHPATAALFAPLWLAERSVCAWLALGARLRGGVRYRDGRLLRAAHTTSELRGRFGTTPVSGARARGPGTPGWS